jgi:hypothetical protein
MKGLPSHVDLSPFAGAELTQLCLGVNQVQFHFANQTSIDVESAMIVRGPGGETRVQDYAQAASLLASMLGARLLVTTRQDDGGVLLLFDSGREIRVLNDSAQFESFQLRVRGQVYVGRINLSNPEIAEARPRRISFRPGWPRSTLALRACATPLRKNNSSDHAHSRTSNGVSATGCSSPSSLAPSRP